jgi:hypothetical protein
MKKLLQLPFAVIVMFFWIFPASAEKLDVAIEYKETIGQYIQVYPSNDSHLSIHDAIDSLFQYEMSLKSQHISTKE